jgi:hypothetical protein
MHCEHIWDDRRICERCGSPAELISDGLAEPPLRTRAQVLRKRRIERRGAEAEGRGPDDHGSADRKLRASRNSTADKPKVISHIRELTKEDDR